MKKITINNNKKITVCFFGAYDKTYTSNKIVMQGLRENGAEVIEVCSHIKVTRLDAKQHMTWIAILKRIAKKYKLLVEIFKHINDIKRSDVIYVGYPGHVEVLLAYIVGKIFGKKVIFFPVITLYTGYVEDQDFLSKKTLLATALKYGEILIYNLCDLVLPDTPYQLEHMKKTFHIPEKKLRSLPIGADDKVYAYTPYTNTKSKSVNVVYYGLYTPLHGVEHIVEAARILKKDKDITFTLVGNGNTFQVNYDRAKSLGLSNMIFFHNTPESEHIGIIQKADIFLGFLQDHPTVKRVIPNKVYQGLALGRVVLCAKSPVIESIFTHEKNIYLCKPSDPQDLAKAILHLKNNPEERTYIAENGYKLFKEEFTPKSVGRILIKYIKDII